MTLNKRTAIVLMLLVSMLAGVTGILAQEEHTVLNVNWSTEPPSIDPSLPSDLLSIQIIEELFVGLGRRNELTLENEPGMATWEVADDGLTYTFTIMQDIPWVHYNADTDAVEEVLDPDGNVRYVDANDFAYGILRTLDPATAGPYAYVLNIAVAGGKEYNTANLDEISEEDLAALRDAVGVTVIDDYTLEIVAPSQAAFVDDILGLWMAVAQPAWLIEAEGDFWTEPEVMQSYGPYALKEWLHDESLTLIANPFWPGTDAVPVPQIKEVHGVMLTDASASFANYEAGMLDVVGAPMQEMDRIKADAELQEELFTGPDYGTYYYGFNHNRPPMDNVHIRRALSYAIDRQSLIDNVTKGGQEPAHWFSRPGLLAAPTMETHPDLGVRYDPDKALEELQLGLEELGLADVSELPPITLSHNESEGHARIAEAIAQMWADELGIEVLITTQEWKVFIANIKNGEGTQVFRSSWFMDYADASNFLYDFFHADATGTGRVHWNNEVDGLNEEFNALVEEALTLDDTEARRELYAQAEQILVVDEAVIIPIYWYTTVSLSKPYLNRTHSLIGNERYEKWSFNE